MIKKTELTFRFKGVNQSGQALFGHIQAKSQATARVELRKQGIITHKITKKRTFFLDRPHRKITSGNIAVFSRQLATLIESGIPLVQSCDIIAKSQCNVSLKNLVESIKNHIETGLTLAEALLHYPAYFNELFCNLVDVGETSGSLGGMLTKVATYKETMETIKKKIKKVLTYPIAVLAIALLVTAGLLLVVIPQFEFLFKGLGADLPELTKAVVTLSKYVQSYWYLILGSFGLLSYGVIYAKNHSVRGAQKIELFLLTCPGIGALLKKAAIARFSRTLSITIAAGLPLVDALQSVTGATGNRMYAKATDTIRQMVSTGQTLCQSMEHTHVFPNMVIQMVTIGEESGTLEHMLAKVADFYEEDLNNAVEALTNLLEPIIMCILGVLVGGLVIAMYLPLFKLGQAI